MQRILSVLFAFLLPSLLSAEEIGTMTVDIDGTQRSFHLISATRGERKMMSASFMDHRQLPSLTLQAHPEPRFTTKDVISVSGSWFGGYEEGKPLTGVEILFLPEGMRNPFYTTDQVGGEPAITLDLFQIDEDTGRASGSFAGKLCLLPGLYEPPDMDDCMNVSGVFDTAIQVVER